MGGFKRIFEGDPGIRQCRDGQNMRLGCRGAEGEATGGGVGEGGREQGQGEERLATTWRAQTEQVERQDDDRVRIEGAASGEGT